MEQRADLYDLRLNRLEQLTSSMVESQASMVQVLQDQSERLDRIEKRLDHLEKMVEQLADDVAFIRNYIETKGMN